MGPGLLGMRRTKIGEISVRGKRVWGGWFRKERRICRVAVGAKMMREYRWFLSFRSFAVASNVTAIFLIFFFLSFDATPTSD